MTLILCPFKRELDHLLEYLSSSGISFEKTRIQKMHAFSLSDRPALLSVGGQGKVQYAISTQYALCHEPSIKRVICAGSAGGLDTKMSLLDVVVASETVETDFKQGALEPLDFPKFPGEQLSLSKLKNMKPEGFRIHTGRIVSIDENIFDSDKSLALRLQTNALATAWEGAGGGRACLFNKVEFVEVRGITDFANHEPKESFFENLPQAMQHVAQVILKLV